MSFMRALHSPASGGKSHRASIRPKWLAVALLTLGLAFFAFGDSDPVHLAANTERPQPWPGGVIPYDISKLTPSQQTIARRAMQRWLDTGANIKFIPRTTEIEYINFTGQTNAGNNTSHVGFKKGERTDINITAFWWRDLEWMPAHELGHVLGFFHEHERWDRDQFVSIHYENIKPGRAHDYDWIAKTNWLVTSLPYDYKSIMHYRVCWASKCEDECTDGDDRRHRARAFFFGWIVFTGFVACFGLGNTTIVADGQIGASRQFS